jgi:hypothetical protein
VRGGLEGMDLEEIKKRLVKKGVAALAGEPDERRRFGGMAGYLACMYLDSPEEFEQVLDSVSARKGELRAGSSADMLRKWLGDELMWQYAARSVGEVYEVMKVAWSGCGARKFPHLRWEAVERLKAVAGKDGRNVESEQQCFAVLRQVSFGLSQVVSGEAGGSRESASSHSGDGGSQSVGEGRYGRAR